jgi:hypothetical protein
VHYHGRIKDGGEQANWWALAQSFASMLSHVDGPLLYQRPRYNAPGWRWPGICGQHPQHDSMRPSSGHVSCTVGAPCTCTCVTGAHIMPWPRSDIVFIQIDVDAEATPART